MGVEHHLLRFARIGPHEQHAAVAEPDVRHLHHRRRAGEHDNLVAPVELIGLTRRERQRDIRFGYLSVARSLPAPRIATDGIVAALIAEPAQLLPHADQRQPLAALSALVLLQ